MTHRPDRNLPAVILAAGVGRRLGSLTADRPKALIEVGGTTLLERQLRALEDVGCATAFIVSGHCAQRLEETLATRRGRISVRQIPNPDYATANNIVSLLAARDVLRDGFCLLNSDIVFDPGILATLWNRTAGSWIVVDTDEILGEEEMKVQVDENGVVHRISKLLDPAISVGEYIGMALFDAIGARALVDSAARLVRAGEVQLYYEDAIDRDAASINVGVVSCEGRPWTEIDDQVDLKRARTLARTLPAVIPR